MDVLSKLFALCAILTITTVALINPPFSGYMVGILIASLFGGISASANSSAQKGRQKGVDEAIQEIWREVQEGNRPRYYLYLRPFHITNRVQVPNSRRSRSTTDLFSTTRYQESTTTDFEIILEDASALRLVALGIPGEAVGAGRILTNDEDWWEKFLQLAQAAEKILVIPSYKSGTKREIEWLKANGHLRKCIFICPPSRSAHDSSPAREWDRSAQELPIQLPVYTTLGKFFKVDDAGHVLREVPIPAMSRAAVSNSIALLEGDKVEPCLSPVTTPDGVALPSLLKYQPAAQMSELLKFVLIVITAIAVGFVLAIFKS